MPWGEVWSYLVSGGLVLWIALAVVYLVLLAIAAPFRLYAAWIHWGDDKFERQLLKDMRKVRAARPPEPEMYENQPMTPYEARRGF